MNQYRLHHSSNRVLRISIFRHAADWPTPTAVSTHLRASAAGVLLGCLFASTLHANPVTPARPIQSLASIRLAAEQFLTRQNTGTGVRVVVRVGRLDRRLRLPLCSVHPRAFLPAAGRTVGNVSVGVRCEGAEPWTLYVPAQVRAYRKVVVLTRALPRGATLSAETVRLEDRDVARLHAGYATHPREAIGLQLKQALAGGRVLSPALLAAPSLVLRGERVTVIAHVGGLEVRTAGRALSNGAAGERVSVKNLRSRRVVEGIVSARGTVRVRL